MSYTKGCTAVCAMEPHSQGGPPWRPRRSQAGFTERTGYEWWGYRVYRLSQDKLTTLFSEGGGGC